MAAASPKKPPGPRKSTDEGGVVEVGLTRLSKGILDTFGVDLDHNQLKKLGYRAEKRHTNPNTYYRLPGVTGSIENCPKVVKHIKKVVLQGKPAEIAMLLGKHAKPKLPPQPPKRQRASAGAAGTAAPTAATSGGGAANIKAEESSQEEEDSDEEMEEAPTAAAAADGLVPDGWSKVDDAKFEKVLEGLATYIQAHTELKNMKGADLKAKGVMVIEESKPLGPGERMRHAHVWWPGNMQEPLRCAQYIFAAKSFLELPAVCLALGLKALQPEKEAAAPAANTRKRPSAAADLAPAAAAIGAPVAPNSAPPAVKRTRRSMSDTAAERQTAAASGKTAPAAVAATAVAAKTSPSAPANAGSGGSTVSLAEGRRARIKQEQGAAASAVAVSTAAGSGAAASGGTAHCSMHIPSSAGDRAAAAAEGAGDVKGAAAAAAGKVRGPSGRFLSKSELAAAAAAAGGSAAAEIGSAPASGRAAAANTASAWKHSSGNQQVLESVDDAVQLLQEALALGALLPPAVLNALPSVFTASLDGTLQDFLAKATAKREGLKADKELLLNMAADYAAEISASARSSKKSSTAVAESHYRRPYLAFRAALGVCAADAHTWLQDKPQREMIARLEGLVQIKKQLEDKKSEEDRLRLEQEQMRLQQERLQEELRAYKERIKRLEEEEAKRKAAAAAAAAPAAVQPADAKPLAADQAA